MYQLIEITDIFSTFDCNPTLQTRAVFLHISIWHKGLYILESMGISGSLLHLMECFLSDWYQRVLLNGQSSKWASITAGVAQGSILGPLLFLFTSMIFQKVITSNAKFFADDTAIFSTAYNINIATSNTNSDLQKVSEWAFKWKMSFNPDSINHAQEVISLKNWSSLSTL